MPLKRTNRVRGEGIYRTLDENRRRRVHTTRTHKRLDGRRFNQRLNGRRPDFLMAEPARVELRGPDRAARTPSPPRQLARAAAFFASRALPTCPPGVGSRPQGRTRGCCRSGWVMCPAPSRRPRGWPPSRAQRR
eukprot:2228217-Pyramimonas_sp.AAC.1